MNDKRQENSSGALDLRDAAAYLQIKEQTLSRLARRKEIPADQVGDSWQFTRGALDRWAEAHLHHRRRRVLVVDDDEVIRDLLRRMLEDSAHVVRAAANGVEALELIRQDTPDVVILDLRMPEMDGPAVLREIRKDWESLPVIIFTGYADSELMTEALQYSPITVLSKPATPEQIVAAVARGAFVPKEPRAHQE